MMHFTKMILSTSWVFVACAGVADAPPPADVAGGGKADGSGSVPDAPSRTISIEVDFVGYQRFEPETINIVTRYFASIGYEIRFVQDEVLEPVDVLAYGNGNPVVAGYYRNHFGHRGQPGWHYMLMADTLSDGNRGWGMIGGDTFEISAEPLDLYPDHRAEAQANIILHELGHNLGLVHEGFEPEISAGTHSTSTCATADTAPAPDVPVTFYSPNCVGHIRLDARPYLTGP